MSENWAVCIGINSYDSLKPLDCARRDAEAVNDFFKDTLHFKNVYFLAEDAPPLKADYGQMLHSRPTFGNLMRFLRVRFEQPFLQPSDNLWFFFAGHGRRERDQDYILPLDADPGNVEETGIPVRYVVERLRRSGAENVVLLLDACRNEGARDGQGVGLDNQRGTVTICSCSPTEFSYEIDDLGHGAFTYGLIEGLRLHGEQNCATVERLDAYLQTRVPEICRLHGKPRQTPCTFAEPLSKRHFILLPDIALPEDLEPLKLEALEAEANDDLALAEQLWWRINAVEPTDAQSRAAIRRIALKFERLAAQPKKPELPAPDPPTPPLPPDDQTVKTSRRRLVIGAAAGAAALAAGGGFLVLPRLMKPRFPELRQEMLQIETVDSEGRPQPTAWQQANCFDQPLGGDNAIEFSMIPAGEFTMGSPDGELLRSDDEGPMFVKVGHFAISRTTITQAQWRSVVLARPSTIRWAMPVDPSSFKGDDLPVETITWQHAWEFCARLSAWTGHTYRLPSQAEWEYACRARTTTPFHFGQTLTPKLANYCGTGGAVCGVSDGRDISDLAYDGNVYPDGAYGSGPAGIFIGQTKPVRSYPTNRFGLFEMHGNVWEYCSDNWSDRLEDIPDNGSPYVGGRMDLHVLRGGSWSHNPAICRSAYRDRVNETSRGWSGRIGFRIVCEV